HRRPDETELILHTQCSANTQIHKRKAKQRGKRRAKNRPSQEYKEDRQVCNYAQKSPYAYRNLIPGGHILLGIPGVNKRLRYFGPNDRARKYPNYSKRRRSRLCPQWRLRKVMECFPKRD